MLKRHTEFLKSLLFLFDLMVICLCWVAAFSIRFAEVFVPVTKGVPPIEPYLWLLLPIVGVWGVAFQAFHLYRPQRMGSHLAEFLDIAQAHTLAVLILFGLTFFIQQFEYSLLVILYFWILGLVLLGFSRMVFREGLRFLRRVGYNQRYVLVLGAGKLAQRMVRSLRQHGEFGLQVQGYLTHDPSKLGKMLEGVPVKGLYSDLKELLPGIDLVFLCFPPGEEENLEKLMEYLSTTVVEVKVVPDFFEFITLRAEAEIFDGLPVITLQGTPLHGWNVFLKRGVDIVGAVSTLILGSPFFLIIAVLIKLTSPGSVFYRQIRMGLDGQTFEIIKFRTMRVDAEASTGPVWAQDNDPRRTSVGAILRRTGLDELPQFFNVLKGEMSVVGPRPERPEFIVQFRGKVPKYMLRHKVKTGITGWAQVNGLRGNTSLEKRSEYDLYYIEHWSILFDLRIIAMTIWRGFLHKNAY